MNTGTLITRPHPLLSRVVSATMPHGLTVHEMAREGGILGPYVAFVNGILITDEGCRSLRPSELSHVVIRSVLRGGGGGGGEGKSTLAIVLSIVVAFASAFVGGAVIGALGAAGWGSAAASAAGALAGAAVGLVGNLLISALIPPPSLGNTGQRADPATQFISGSRNSMNPYGTLPQVLGRFRMYGPYLARPYTEIVGNDQYLRAVVTFGHGPLAIEDIKIGETPITSFDDVEYEWREGRIGDAPLTLFPESVREESLTVDLGQLDKDTQWDFLVTANSGKEQTIQEDGTLTANSGTPYSTANVGDTIFLWGDNWHKSNIGAFRVTAVNSGDEIVLDPPPEGFKKQTVGGISGRARRATGQVVLIQNNTDNWQERRTAQEVDEISVDVTWPEGLYEVSSSGRKKWVSAVEVEYRKVGDANWTYVTTFNLRENYTSAIRRSTRWQVAETAQYDVRLRNVMHEKPTTKYRDRTIWTTLRSILTTDEVATIPVSKLAVRIKATDQLNGIIDSLNAVVQTKMSDWDSGTSSWGESASSNPASVYRYILQGDANARPLDDARIDLESLQTWHEYCDAQGFEYNRVFDSSMTVFEVLQEVCAAGKAAFMMRDGQYSIVRDVVQPVPVQMFTPRNSSGYRISKVFRSQPHALKVQFINPAKDWEQDEHFVYDDGYDSTNATEFERLVLTGVTNTDQAWKLGRYWLAVGRLRPEEHTINVDWEHLVCTRGDKILLTHDVPSIGASFGRIKSLTLSGSDIVGVTLDANVTMEEGTSYRIRVRESSGDIQSIDLTTVAGTTDELTFTGTVTGIDIDDLVVFGEATYETAEMIVKSILPRDDMSATLVMVAAAEAVHEAHEGAIPPYDSGIRDSGDGEALIPPTILEVNSDIIEGELSLSLRVVMGSLPQQTDGDFVAQVYESQWKPSDSFAWVDGPSVLVSNPTIVILHDDLAQGDQYDVRVRIRGYDGRATPWRTVSGYTLEGDSTSPSVPENLRVDNDYLTWDYPDPPNDLAGFLVRFDPNAGTSWDDAFALHNDPVTSFHFDLSAHLAGTRSFFVKAVDIYGNESTTAAYVEYTEPDDEEVFSVVCEDHVADSFANGTISGGTVVSDELVADSDIIDPDEVEFWGSDSGKAFWSSDGTKSFWSVGTAYTELQYTTTFSPSFSNSSSVYRIDTTELALVGTNARLEYRYLGGSSWYKWPGRLSGIQSGTQIEFRITIDGGTVQGKITALKFCVTSELIEETLTNVTIAAGGTRLPITKTYSVIQQVGDLHVRNNTSSSSGSFPLGSVVTGPSLPSDGTWLEPTGQTLNRADYPELWAWAQAQSIVDDAVATKFGNGDGSTTFRMPDWRGLSVFGKRDADAILATGGEREHLLTSAESGSPAHSHESSGGSHTHEVIDPGHDHGGVTGPGGGA